jgi:hypothetical protein
VQLSERVQRADVKHLKDRSGGVHGFENAAGRAQDEWSASKAGLKELSEHLRLLLHLPNPVDHSIRSF